MVCVALVSGLTGCSSGNPWDTVDVSGKITYEDGSLIPVSSMKLYFAPQTPPVDEKTFPRQGSVGVNAADGSFDSGNLAPGESFVFAFEQAGTYSYACAYHPNMQGTVVVE